MLSFARARGWLLACACVADPPGPGAPGEGEAEAEAEAEAEGEGCVPRSCPGGEENPYGVGRCCDLSDQCRGATAVTCGTEVAKGGPDFCTMPCSFDVDCGEGARCCVGDGDQPMCWPAACAPPGCAAPDAGIDKSCPGQARPPQEAVNALGLGRPCTTAADCAGLTMSECPGERFPVAPHYCSGSCTCNDDCGPEGICFDSPVGGTCRPAVCHPGDPGLSCGG